MVADLVEAQKVLYSFAIDAILYLIASFHFIYGAGRLNDEYEGHLRLIQSNKGHFNYLLYMKHFYFGHVIGFKTVNGKDFAKALPESSHSYLFLYLRDEILDELEETLENAEDKELVITRYLEERVSDYDYLNQEIEREMSYEQVTNFGLAVTKNSVINFFIGIVSLIFAIYQLIITGGKNNQQTSTPPNLGLIRILQRSVTCLDPLV
eukprot:GABU01005163.1.p2 GENE.GABU01005163.1~~GABU01005163.1.p2  ORF type:complete len:208 (-),score=42.02 GABU01005163.1:85-708(-)